jgi:hypothetical protein
MIDHFVLFFLVLSGLTLQKYETDFANSQRRVRQGSKKTSVAPSTTTKPPTPTQSSFSTSGRYYDYVVEKPQYSTASSSGVYPVTLSDELEFGRY